MTLVERPFYYRLITEAAARALDRVRQVYGIWGVRLDESDRVIRVEYDVSRLTYQHVTALLRSAGIDVRAEELL